MKTFIALLVFCTVLASLMVEEANAYCCSVDSFPLGHPPACNIFGCNCDCTECAKVDDKLSCAAEKTAKAFGMGNSRKRRTAAPAASAVFQKADQNGDGAISMEEAVHYFATKWNMTESDLRSADSKHWFAELDLDGDGKLQPNEVDAALAL